MHARDKPRSPFSWLGLPEFDPGVPGVWGRRTRWYSRSRWTIAPLIILSVLGARALGFEFSFAPVLVIAVLHPIYNSVLVWSYRRVESAGHTEDSPRVQVLLLLEVLADYLAMFGLIYFTGGAHSPLTLFLIFHVILAATQFSKRRAFMFASWAALGIWIIFFLHESAAVVVPPILFHGESIVRDQGMILSVLRLCFLTATLILVGLITGKIMESLRRRVDQVAETTRMYSDTSEKLGSLYAIVGSMGAERRIQPILDLVAAQLDSVFENASVTIALLNDDGTALRIVASHGFSDDFFADREIEVGNSGFHNRVLLGETMVQGTLQEQDPHPLRRHLHGLGVRSLIVARMAADGRPIGTIGLYSSRPDRFRDIDAKFLEMIAELVAIAVEDARANEENEGLVKERTRLMLEVAHNLRAPLGASMGLLDLVVSGYSGSVDGEARVPLERVMERLKSLDDTVGELLQIAKSRDWAREIPDVVVQVGDLAREVESTFRSEAEKRKVRFHVDLEDGLPTVESGGDLVAKILENLVSNAIKYTPEGGDVHLSVSSPDPARVRITVADTGIGIPANEQDRLFHEFFRATNAKKLHVTGTGLGLAFIKQAVDRHRGHLSLESEEGKGTRVTVDLYSRRPEERPALIRAATTSVSQ